MYKRLSTIMIGIVAVFGQAETNQEPNKLIVLMGNPNVQKLMQFDEIKALLPRFMKCVKKVEDFVDDDAVKRVIAKIEDGVYETGDDLLADPDASDIIARFASCEDE